jgi:hypothetical protein
MAVVVFDPAAFKVRYPLFAAVSDALLSACFDESGMYLSNADTSPVQSVPVRTQLLWMLTAHIAFLGGALNVDKSPQPVGRVSQAAEGSVSASFDYVVATPGSGAWFNQTQWGASFWQATSNLRGFRYMPRPTRIT